MDATHFGGGDEDGAEDGDRRGAAGSAGAGVRHWCQTGPSWVTMARTAVVGRAGGVMRLGKALATGVAEEQALTHEEAFELPEIIEVSEASVPDEVPAGR